MSDHIGLIRFTGVDGQSRQVAGYMHDIRLGDDPDDDLDMAFTLQPLTETVTIGFDASQLSPDALALLFGDKPEETEPPFPDPEDDSRE